MPTLKQQKEMFPVGAAVETIEGSVYFPAGAAGVVEKHYGKGTIYVRFGRSAGVRLDARGERKWFVGVENLRLRDTST